MTDKTLKRINGGARLQIRDVARPGSREPAAITRSVAEVVAELAEHCPEGHFLKHISAKCAGLRDGVPSSTRFHVALIFEPYPPTWLQQRGRPREERS